MSNLAKIEEIYHAALEKTTGERDKFLNEICGDEAELLREIEALLEFDEKAQDFIETPPEDLAAALFEKGSNPKNIGKTLNHYRIMSHLGAGGMGEVYLAEDIKLGRKIALKLLPKQFQTDTERKKRFEQEARAVSALNHPNIITIYGIEETEDINFIATEFIDGQTLREKINEKSLCWQKTIEIALQITSALESAHSVGIIHRDIKPANIMVRRDGIVKVLDFGLAKLTAQTADSGDFKTQEQTAPNRVMGTINYMSPEQALGEKVDTRTDIFSLGVVLYEMLSGVQPFRGTSDAAIYNATINKNPPSVSELRAEIPPAFDRIIKRAIEKKRENRYQTISDLSADLQKLKENPNLSSGIFFAFRPQKKTLKLLFPLAAAAILLFAGVYFAIIRQATAENQTTENSNFNYTQLTSQSGEELYPSLSPDGKTFIYSTRATGKWDIYFQRVGGANAVNLTADSPADDRQPAFSPNGEQIVFRSERDGGGIFIMGATGESVRRISNEGFYPAWSPDGTEIVYCIDDFDEPGARSTVPSQLWIVNIASGEKRLLTKSDAVQPNWSPNGHRIAYWGIKTGGQRDIKTISASGGEAVQVTDDASIDWNPVWSADGKYLYFASNRGGSMNLWRVRIEEKTGEVSGTLEAVTIPSTYSQFFSFARDGKHFAYVQSNIYTNIFQIDFDPQTETLGESSVEITQGSKITTNVQISPNDDLIVFDSIGDKQENIFVANADGTGIRQITGDTYKNRAPRWSPDGKRIAFFTDKTGIYEGWTINPDGSNLKLITKLPEKVPAQLPVWSPDGKKLLFNTTNGYPVIFDPDKAQFEQTPEPLPVEADPNRRFMAYSWSPDGNKLIGYGKGADELESYIIQYDFETKDYKKITEFGIRPVWLSDNQRFLYIHRNKIFLFDMKKMENKELLTSATKEFQSISISKDNKKIYYSLKGAESDIWLASVL